MKLAVFSVQEAATLHLAIAALSALGAFAQPKAGTISVIPKLGLNLSNLTNQDILYSSTNPEYQPTTIKSKFREGIVFGADVQYQRTDRFALSLGALYSKEGCRYSDISDSYKQNNIRYVSLTADQHIAVDYLNIPLVAHFYVADNLALNAGVQLGIALSAHHLTQVFNLALLFLHITKRHLHLLKSTRMKLSNTTKIKKA